ATRERTVKTYCEKWVREGYILPRDADAGAKVPNLYHRLMQASATRVMKFGEGGATLSEFDSLVAEVEARGPGHVRLYGERVREQPPGQAAATLTPERRAQLLSHTVRGRLILSDEARQKK